MRPSLCQSRCIRPGLGTKGCWHLFDLNVETNIAVMTKQRIMSGHLRAAEAVCAETVFIHLSKTFAIWSSLRWLYFCLCASITSAWGSCVSVFSREDRGADLLVGVKYGCQKEVEMDLTNLEWFVTPVSNVPAHKWLFVFVDFVVGARGAWWWRNADGRTEMMPCWHVCYFLRLCR
jgi:hypothetical protein